MQIFIVPATTSKVKRNKYIFLYYINININKCIILNKYKCI